MRKGSEGLVRARARRFLEFAGVAQPVEHLICNQRVGGSNPFASSRVEAVCRRKRSESLQPKSRASFARELKNSFFRQAADSVLAAQQVFPTHSIRNFSGL